MAERHRLELIDPDARTATCMVCGPGVGVRSNGMGGWRCRTVANRNKRYRAEGDNYRWHTRKPHREHMADTCAGCGFVAEHPGLLDVHHVNGDHGDNRPENLATLCPICHRRVHYGLPLPLHPLGQ